MRNRLCLVAALLALVACGSPAEPTPEPSILTYALSPRMRSGVCVLVVELTGTPADRAITWKREYRDPGPTYTPIDDGVGYGFVAIVIGHSWSDQRITASIAGGRTVEIVLGQEHLAPGSCDSTPA